MMKRAFILIILALLLIAPLNASARGGGRGGGKSGSSVSVKGHARKDGTYVKPHRRSAPDGSKINNWTTKGNVNPYTGKSGTRSP